MVHSEDLLWGFSVISFSLFLFNSITKSFSASYFFSLLCFSSSSSSSNDHEQEEEKLMMVISTTDHDHMRSLDKADKQKPTSMKKNRPEKLIMPMKTYDPELDQFEEAHKRMMESKEVEVQGQQFCLASKKGRRQFMEDGYGVLTDILGHSNHAFFAVIDGHGGPEAMEYVAENLGKNIVKAMEGDDDDDVEEAIRKGYLVTDKEFLSQGVRSGACAASVVLKNGELHVANVGDCRVVLSRNGIATPLTLDHRVSSREDECLRIQNSGGYVLGGRVQATLAVSRAIGDLHLKEWVISEPEIAKVELSPDCQFLVMASDGLWDKVGEQEAVDEVSRHITSNSNILDIINGGVMESCKKLVKLAFNRGNLDDATVMVVSLANFVQPPLFNGS